AAATGGVDEQAGGEGRNPIVDEGQTPAVASTLETSDASTRSPPAAGAHRPAGENGIEATPAEMPARALRIAQENVAIDTGAAPARSIRPARAVAGRAMLGPHADALEQGTRRRREALTDLVAAQIVGIDHDRAGAVARETDRGRRAGGSSPDDGNVDG